MLGVIADLGAARYVYLHHRSDVTSTGAKSCTVVHQVSAEKAAARVSSGVLEIAVIGDS